MRINLNSLVIRKDIDRVEMLHWGHFSFFVLATILELFNGHIGFLVIPKLILLFIFYHLFTRTRRNLYYSFWTFAITLSIYFLIKLLGGVLSGAVLFSYFLALIILCSEMYILMSPIYYPRVNWWEYDFRYRDDLKVKILFNEKELDGRLTDLRREAGCVALFKDIPIGSKFKIQLIENWDNVVFNAEVMSKRYYSLGRPITYGVKFSLEGIEDKSMFSKFVLFWRNERVLKQKLKFQN
jgi:hypothetical protein